MRGYPSRSDFKVEIGGGTLAAISAILASLIEPTPDGMAATRPSASAPHRNGKKGLFDRRNATDFNPKPHG
jgi:hypothetical protein